LKGAHLYRGLLFPYTPSSMRKKYIFIHIPKAAGTAVRSALGEPPVGRQHLPWWVYHQSSPVRFGAFFKFAFVRDPLDRALSGYKYLKAGGNQEEDIKLSTYLRRYSRFDEFVEEELFRGQMIYHPIFRPQSWYLCDWTGATRVDFLGRFESISRDFEHVADKLRLNNFNGLPVVNKSMAPKEEVGSYAKEIIKEIYKHDYEAFGY